jgi:putative radical SAM enzyme (TIGR03279 family)
MKDEDIDRMIFYHLSPINISVHTTNMDLRVRMLKNPNASRLMEQLDRLYESGIELNFQIVLCRDINDGEELDKSIADLSKYIEHAPSMSVVPFGKTRFREGLEQIRLFDKESAVAVIDKLEAWQSKLYKEYGKRFCFASDEFYLLAERAVPDYESYEGFPQLENGVGMLRLMESEYKEAIKNTQKDNIKRNITFVTAKSAFDFIFNMSCDIMDRLSGTEIEVVRIDNRFFGESITVSGLMTGQDIIAQLKDRKRGKYLFIPENAFRCEEPVMLDDIDIDAIERELGVKVVKASNDGAELIRQVVEAQ